jgi:hypothetical protein
MHCVIRSRVWGVNPILSKLPAFELAVAAGARSCGRLFGNAKFAVAGALACLAFAHAAIAAPMTGSMAVVVYPLATPTSSFTASSLTLNAQNLITTGSTGDFAAQVPSLSDLTANTTTIAGLSASPLADSIANYFVFATPDAIFGGAGTTPNNRFDFNLATITEPSLGVFSGTGTIVDTATSGAFDNTPAEFTLSFSSASNYSFTIAAVSVPEPTTLGLIATGLMGALSFRRRRVAR